MGQSPLRRVVKMDWKYGTGLKMGGSKYTKLKMPRLKYARPIKTRRLVLGSIYEYEICMHVYILTNQKYSYDICYIKCSISLH